MAEIGRILLVNWGRKFTLFRLARQQSTQIRDLNIRTAGPGRRELLIRPFSRKVVSV